MSFSVHSLFSIESFLFYIENREPDPEDDMPIGNNIFVYFFWWELYLTYQINNLILYNKVSVEAVQTLFNPNQLTLVFITYFTYFVFIMLYKCMCSVLNYFQTILFMQSFIILAVWLFQSNDIFSKLKMRSQVSKTSGTVFVMNQRIFWWA